MSPVDQLPPRIRTRIKHQAAPSDRSVVGPCWIWTGGKTSAGYGQTQWDGKQRYLHRITYTTFGGEIPDGHQIDHLCRVRACCNPAHLEAVTPRVNVLRGLIGSKTECVNGHPLSGDNLMWSNNGPNRTRHRRCRTCFDASQVRTRARYGAKRNAERRARYVPKRDPLRCRNGHEWAAGNARITPAGYRICRECERSTKKRYQARLRLAAAS